jgi:hypothetical protein
MKYAFRVGQKVVSLWDGGTTKGLQATVIGYANESMVIKFDKDMKGKDGGSIHKYGRDYDLYVYTPALLKDAGIAKSEKKHGVVGMKFNTERRKR